MKQELWNKIYDVILESKKPSGIMPGLWTRTHLKNCGGGSLMLFRLA